MKIAIPCVENQLCMHFGHCDQFAVVTVESKKITGVELLTPPPHEPGLLPRWLHEQDVELVIAGGMGQRAQQIFAANNIKTIVGAPADTPENLVEAWLNGTLVAGENACDH